MGRARNWMLGAALALGVLGLGATSAHAARVRIAVGFGGPVAYIPPSPGPGYFWVAGYTYNGYWVPGRWQYDRHYRPYSDGRYYGRHWRERDRGWIRARDRRYDRRAWRRGYRR